MVFKLVNAAAKTSRRLKRENRLPKIEASNSKTVSRSSKCGLTTPPDRTLSPNLPQSSPRQGRYPGEKLPM
jgi:hypothetical protein